MTIIPEGWVLAPCEPDLNQLAAAINAETTGYAPEPNLVVCDFIDPSNHVAAMGAYERNKADSGGEWTRAFLTTIYRAMLASAPPAPGGFGSSRDHDPSDRSALEGDDPRDLVAMLERAADGGYTLERIKAHCADAAKALRIYRDIFSGAGQR